MLTGKLKYFTIALLVIVMIVLSLVVYRMYWKFKPSKVRKSCADIADLYMDSQTVYKILIEGTEAILKSADESKQVEIMAKAEGVSLERMLAVTAQKKAVAAGFIDDFIPAPPEGSTENTAGDE